MLDQSFSVKNFREIYDIENRKGLYLENFFDELKEVHKITEAIKQARLSIKNAKTKAEKKSIYNRIKEYKNNKNLKLDECFLEVEKQIQSGEFRAILEKGPVVHKKQTYVFKKSLVNFCASKQVQKNLSKVFNVKPASRNTIVSQLKAVLQDDLPKVILRTDISNFYEDIPHSVLLDIIDSNKLLSVISKKYIKQVIKNYSIFCGGKNTGVPRGIGVSAYLSEIYMSKLDELIQNMPNLGYYGRYVDDIVLVLYPDRCISKQDIVTDIAAIYADMCLRLNRTKTKVINVNKKIKNQSFEFLGYKMIISSVCEKKERHIIIKIKFSDAKKERLQKRIQKAFKIYDSTKNKRAGGSILYNRIKFLTSNTRLLNSKNNVVIGIYYSNKFITEIECLQELDVYLNMFIRETNDIHLAEKLRACSFEKGWLDRIYCKVSSNRLKQITKIWHYDENC